MVEPDGVTPNVGDPVPAVEADQILREFDNRLCRVRLAEESANLPSWYFLRDRRDADEGIFKTRRFLSNNYVYVLTEYPRRLFKAEPAAVASWIHDILDRWAAPDACVFPSDFKWCCAMNMDDEFFASGEVDDE